MGSGLRETVQVHGSGLISPPRRQGGGSTPLAKHGTRCVLYPSRAGREPQDMAMSLTTAGSQMSPKRTGAKLCCATVVAGGL